MIKMLLTCLTVAVLTAGLAHGSGNRDSQDCRGGSEARALAQRTSPSRTSGGSDLSAASPSKAHSVRLSWDASVPASNSPADTVVGYNIYRREPGKNYEKINLKPIAGTNCVDHSVKVGQTYEYETVAVSAQGKNSKPSNVTKVTIPSQ